ncbi:MAG: CsbD family protein [Pirellulaceae bacterium]|nr:CsbD family protein [Pirellulaceae bacterium]
MITKEHAQGNWKTIIGAVKEKFSQITGDELTGIEGNLDKLIGLVQRKSGQSREWVEAFLTDASDASKDVAQRVSNTASQYASQAVEVVRDNYENLSNAAHRGYEQVSDAASRGYDNTVKTVSNRPLESIAIALGCGVLTGLVVGLSMASKRR